MLASAPSSIGSKVSLWKLKSSKELRYNNNMQDNVPTVEDIIHPEHIADDLAAILSNNKIELTEEQFDAIYNFVETYMQIVIEHFTDTEEV